MTTEHSKDEQEVFNAILRNDFPSFLYRSFLWLNPGAQFLPNWHIHAIAYQLDRIRRGEITRLIINLPPRYLKSITVSVAFSAFLLGLDPYRRIIAISYGDELSAKHASDFRSITNSDWYRRAFPRMGILRSVESELITTRRGFRKSTSVSGTLTGLGGDLFIIDDPQKPVDAQSEARRTSLKQLTLLGFEVWSDLNNLKAGDRFWEDIESTIRLKSAKVIVVLSKSSQTKANLLDEIDLAIRVERAENITRFVIPVRIDEIGFDQVRANLARKNIIDFNQNWANGLMAILGALDKDRVPKRTGNLSNATSKIQLTGIHKVPLVTHKPELLTSNWLLINGLPNFIRLFDVAAPGDQIESIVRSLHVPSFKYLRLVGSFSRGEGIAGSNSALPTLTEKYAIPFDDFLRGTSSELPGMKARDAHNLSISMLRQAWDFEMDKRGLRSFAMASNALAWYMPTDFIPNNKVQFLDATGKKRRKSLVGWSERRKVFWHFAVEARPVLGAHPRFVLRQHIIFTADGSTPLVSKDRMHTLRRRFCKSWWNDRWRDMLIAFVTWLGPSAGLNLGGDTVLGLDDHLFALWSPLSLEDDANVSVESTDEIEDDELSTDDDVFDLADTSEFSPSEVSEVIGE